MSEYIPPKFVARAILHILLSYQGDKNRVQKSDLLRMVNHQLQIRNPHPTEPPTQLDDRILRAAIEWLRANDPQGALICSSLQGGYFLAESLAELRENLAPDRSRAMAILDRISRQEKLASTAEGGQIRMAL